MRRFVPFLAAFLCCQPLAFSNTNLDLSSGRTETRCVTTVHIDQSWAHVVADLDQWALLGGDDIVAITGQNAVLAHFAREGIAIYDTGALDFQLEGDPLLMPEDGGSRLWAVPVQPPVDLPEGLSLDYDWNARATGSEPPCDYKKKKDCAIIYIIG